MALGRHKGRQSELLVTWVEMPRSPGHVLRRQILHRFPDRRQVLSEGLGDVGLHRSGRRRLPLPFRQHHAVGVMGQANLLPEQPGGVLRLSGSRRFGILGMVPLLDDP